MLYRARQQNGWQQLWVLGTFGKSAEVRKTLMSRPPGEAASPAFAAAGREERTPEALIAAFETFKGGMPEKGSAIWK